jgi:hypothetical protein
MISLLMLMYLDWKMEPQRTSDWVKWLIPEFLVETVLLVAYILSTRLGGLW